METKHLYSYIDHTALKATTTWVEIQTLCDEAITYGAASVCIPACYVKRVKETYGDALPICTVVGFPLGYSTTAAKVAESVQAVAEGAVEVDMVVNLCDVKNGDFSTITQEISAIKTAIGDYVLKVIVETCYLTEEEKVQLCHCVSEAKADFIKTSTGFGTGGALLQDVLLFKEHIAPSVKIKAAGGVKSVADMEAFASAGCHRIGSSSGIAMLNALN